MLLTFILIKTPQAKRGDIKLFPHDSKEPKFHSCTAYSRISNSSFGQSFLCIMSAM